VNLRFETDLDPQALRDLVDRIASQPGVWRPLVRLDAGQRHFAQLWRDDHVDVWVISWMPGHDTGYHDHDLSSGAVAVVDGVLVEERLAIGSAPRRRRYGVGETFDFDAAHVHRMHQPGPDPSVSIHAYSPPLWRMGSYAIEADGTLRRTSISYAEELRPAQAG
jgi:predicted metal-dependent enzyme (double-stranded beta helix superfamily)